MTTTVIRDPRPPVPPPVGSGKHAHYSYRDFLKFDRQSGQIIDWNGHQNLLLSEDFIVGLQTGLEHEVGDASGAVMYAIGNDWGKQDAASFALWFEKEFSISIKKAHPLFLLETWWWPFTAQGWGKWEVETESKQKGFIFIDLFDSMVAQTLGDVGKPVCHLYAGLFAGFFSSITERNLACIEIQCYAMGENFCKFLLGSEKKIDAANFWVNEGASARDIERRLHDTP